MADLQETQTWTPGIYQIETNDPVVGGPPDLAQGEGISNVQALQLASRTAWLKLQIAELSQSVADIDFGPQIQAKFDELVDSAPGALNTLNELAVALQSNDSEIAALVSQIAAMQNSVNNIDVTAQINAAINNIVDGAPAALNTLRELALALQGNDSDIAALVSQISGVQTTYNNLVAGAPANLNTLAELASAIQAQQQRKPTYTVLAEYPTRKYDGTITLSQPMTNFDSLIWDAVHYNLGATHHRYWEFPRALTPQGHKIYLGSSSWAAHWIYTSATTLTLESEYYSRINRVIGVKY